MESNLFSFFFFGGIKFRKSWFINRVKELQVTLSKNDLDVIFKEVGKYDDLLRVEIGDGKVVVGVKRYLISKNSIVVKSKVERLTIPLFWRIICLN
ncbi:hypothetical protein MUP77_01335 [Candidatus Bathyarchaeota archaeon]|nr:hypothetical protein [Candidatus Bathyarchaeota archaeon]